ncbi:hypothetical protein M405DRAFT_888597, partial [Rhizopogon salebrosus TDB-379]
QEGSEVVDSAEKDDLNTDQEINNNSEVVDSAEEDDLNTDQEMFDDDESEVIDSFFRDSICPEEEMGYDEDGTDIDIIHRQKDRAKHSVATNVRAIKTKAAKPTAMKRWHPYAHMDDHGAHPKVHGDGGNHAPFLPAPFDPNCPWNGHPLAAPAAWQVQARALATPHANSVSPSLNVGGWVNEIGSYLQDPHYVKLQGGSIGDMIKQCRSISHQQTGASFVAMVTYMQLAILCRR